MQQILATTTGLVLAGIGWLVRRWLRRDAVDDVINRRLKLVQLYRQTKAAGLDPRALDRLERDLSRKEDSRS